ncbi:MAG: neutral zinc metallopeptidase [Vicinamibacteria bacterium]
MRWSGREGSSNVEDRRGMGIGRGPSLGCGGLLVVGVIALLTGADPRQILQLLSGAAQAPTEERGETRTPREAPKDELGKFASVVLRDTEVTWSEIFERRGSSYPKPTMVLFSRAVRSACGTASSAVGPFYCPADRKVYLDVSFFSELNRKLGAPGDFAAAYVIAHEVGHHVQQVLGVSSKVEQARRRGSEAEANQLSVRLELQADCLAGVWGYYANKERQIIEPGDFEEGLRAAGAIGDDRLQEMGQGSVQPESWTHGSSEQRQTWLRQGLTTGDLETCDTFRSRR